VIFKSDLFPQEYAPMVATGEMTGDVPGALERLSQVSRVEYDTGTVKSKAFTSTLGCTTLLAVTGFVTIMIYYIWYHDVYGALANTDNPSAAGSTGGTSTGNAAQDNLADPDK
jgi:hypothetical protein